MFGDVAGWQNEVFAEDISIGGAALDDGDLERAVGADGLDAVVFPVDRVPAVGLVAGDGPVQLAGLDQIPHPGHGALQAEADAVLLNVSEPD